MGHIIITSPGVREMNVGGGAQLRVAVICPRGPGANRPPRHFFARRSRDLTSSPSARRLRGFGLLTGVGGSAGGRYSVGFVSSSSAQAASALAVCDRLSVHARVDAAATIRRVGAVASIERVVAGEPEQDVVVLTAGQVVVVVSAS